MLLSHAGPRLHASNKGFALPAEDTAGNPPNAAFQEGTTRLCEVLRPMPLSIP